MLYISRIYNVHTQKDYSRLYVSRLLDLDYAIDIRDYVTGRQVAVTRFSNLNRYFPFGYFGVDFPAFAISDDLKSLLDVISVDEITTTLDTNYHWINWQITCDYNMYVVSVSNNLENTEIYSIIDFIIYYSSKHPDILEKQSFTVKTYNSACFKVSWEIPNFKSRLMKYNLLKRE